MILFIGKEKIKIIKAERWFTICFTQYKACIKITYMFLSTGTINHYYIYPNEKHWNFFFAIADLNVTIPNELEHHGLELVYPDLSDLSL